MRDAAPRRVLRLSLLAWGLGEIAMGRLLVGGAWLLAEAIGVALVAGATLLLADTTWYLVPFVVGMAFIAVWSFQAVAAYRRAQRHHGDAAAPAPDRSPAAGAAWLTIPLLVWGTGFWLFAAGSASPASILDRFVAGWTQIAEGTDATLAQDPALLSTAAASALADLQRLCSTGVLPEDCDDAPENLLRDIRFRIDTAGDGTASAVAELVRFDRRPARFIGIFEASELVPVPMGTVLSLEMVAQPAALGSQRWIIVNAVASETVSGA